MSHEIVCIYLFICHCYFGRTISDTKNPVIYDGTA